MSIHSASRRVFEEVLHQAYAAVVGMYISFNPPGYLSVMHCLIHAIKPKTYIKDKYPNVKNTWDAYGIPEQIVTDNGPEFHGIHFEDACLQLGTAVNYAPPRRGQHKGSVERFFRTQNQELLHEQPGTTFSNIVDLADYDPKKNAVISIDALQELTHKFIVDIYHQSKHRILQDAPARVWQVAIAEYPPALPRRHQDLQVLLGCIAQRTISASGIELHTLFYNDERLAGLRRRLKPGERAAVKYDPSDLSMIHVADKENDEYITVPAVNQAYTQNLSLWQHNIIRRHANQIAKGSVDIVALCLAKEELQEIVNREWLKTQKTRRRQVIARFVNYGSQPTIENQQINRGEKGPALISGGSGNNLTLLRPDRVLDGITTLNRMIDVIPGDISESEGENIRSVSSPNAEHSRISKKAGTKRRKLGQKILSKPVNIGDREVINSTTNEGGDEVSFDMTGWDADYDLPR
jgi:putative transposase